MATEQTLNAIEEALPEGFQSEQLNGMLIVQGAPSFEHQQSILYTCTTLRNISYYAGWVFSFSTKLSIPSDLNPLYKIRPGDIRGGYFQPDIMGWKLSDYPDGTVIQTAVPTWICEVQSTNADYDWNTKKPIYEAMGVQYLWMVNPAEFSLHAFTILFKGETYTLLGRECSRFHAPFSQWAIDYDKLFAIQLGYTP